MDKHVTLLIKYCVLFLLHDSTAIEVHGLPTVEVSLSHSVTPH